MLISGQKPGMSFDNDIIKTIRRNYGKLDCKMLDFVDLQIQYSFTSFKGIFTMEIRSLYLFCISALVYKKYNMREKRQRVKIF